MKKGLSFKTDATKDTSAASAAKRGPPSLACSAALAAAIALSGCASIDSLRTSTPLADPAPVLQAPAQWYAPMQAAPHGGQTQQLTQWWASLGDTALVDLLAAAQQNGATVAQAASRITQARAALTLAGGAARPTLSAQAGASRAATSPAQPAASVLQGGLQAALTLQSTNSNVRNSTGVITKQFCFVTTLAGFSSHGC